VKLFYEWDWAGAEKEFRRAIELEPNYPTAHHWYALYLAVVGRIDAALASARRALELDPVSLIANAELGRLLYFARRYDESLQQCQKALEIDPNFGYAHSVMGSAYAGKGMYEAAAASIRKYSMPGAQSSLARGLALSGNRGDARKILEAAKEERGRRYVSALTIASIHVGLGEQDQAFQWLEQAYEERSLRPEWIVRDPAWDPLRSDPRWAALMRRVGLEP